MTSKLSTAPAGNGNVLSLLAQAAQRLGGFFVAGQQGAPISATAPSGRDLSLWELYRLTVGYDSISPKVAAQLRRKLVGER